MVALISADCSKSIPIKKARSVAWIAVPESETFWPLKPLYASTSFLPAVYDAATQQVVALDDYTDLYYKRSVLSLTTITWNGSWRLRSSSTTTNLPTSIWVKMAYDQSTKTVVVFGIFGHANAPIAETWSWNGYTWTELHPSSSPPPLACAAMSYDAATKSVLLYGGGISNTSGQGGLTVLTGLKTISQKTWSWNGYTWTELHPSSSPPPLACAAMSYDAATKSVLLYGGQTIGRQQTGQDLPVLNSSLLSPGKPPFGHYIQSFVSSETWSWNGHNWSRLHPAESPPALFGATMVYCTATQEIMMYGGAGNLPIASMWDWNGHTWARYWTWKEPHSATGAVSPAPRFLPQITYDTATKEIIIPPDGESTTTWILPVK